MAVVRFQKGFRKAKGKKWGWLVASAGSWCGLFVGFLVVLGHVKKTY